MSTTTRTRRTARPAAAPAAVFSDPTIEELAAEWRKVAGYPANTTDIVAAFQAVWAWPNGTLKTDPSPSGAIAVSWGWVSGSVRVTIAREA